MYATLALALIALCGYAEASTLRIIGGEVADPDNYPFYAQVIREVSRTVQLLGTTLVTKITNEQCGGTIINERFVLTAWHCVAKDPEYHPEKGIAAPERFEVRYNIKDVCSGSYDTVKVEEVIPHDGYLTHPMNNDIALLKLEEAPMISSSPSISLPLPSSSYPEGYQGVTIGLGNEEHAKHSLVKTCYIKQLGQTVVDPRVCQRVLHNKNVICTKESGDLPTSNICYGDSGGPLLAVEDYNGQPESYTLMGVTSTTASTGCWPKVSYGGEFVDVSKYIDWINENTSDR